MENMGYSGRDCWVGVVVGIPVTHFCGFFYFVLLPRLLAGSMLFVFRRVILSVNLWGFDRNTSIGPEKGAYFHPCFQRDQPLVVEKLRRVRAIPKIPAKERRRRQALLKQQQQPPQQPQSPQQAESQPYQPPRIQQQPQQLLEMTTNATHPQTSSENPETTPLIPLVEDGLSALLGVAETLSALRRQPPPEVNAATSAVLAISPFGNNGRM